MLQNREELEQVLHEHLGAAFSRHAYGMRRWVDLFAARIPKLADADDTELVAAIVHENARHAVLFRERARAHGVNPDLYVCPPEGLAIYTEMEPLDTEATFYYALGSLEHFGQLLDTYAAVAEDPRDKEVLAQVRADNDRGIADLHRRLARNESPATAKAHELYRLRELAETKLYATVG